MITLTVIVDENLAIGYKNRLLAKISEDLKHFKETTIGKTVVMGYNTYLSLPDKSRPLPNRDNIVITSKDVDLDGVRVMHSIEEALELIDSEYSDSEVIVMGGESIYRQFLPHADRLVITHVFRQFKADAYFPDIPEEWEIVDVEAKRVNINHEFPHVFTTYEKKK